MKAPIIGETYTDDDLKTILGDCPNERLVAVGNEDFILVLQDEGNGNYRLLHVIYPDAWQNSGVFLTDLAKGGE